MVGNSGGTILGIDSESELETHSAPYRHQLICRFNDEVVYIGCNENGDVTQILILLPRILDDSMANQCG